MQIIKSGAIFISDSHENEKKLYFLEFLEAVKSGKIRPTQLFLMGDMFDYLSFTDYSRKFYAKQILLINEISKSVPCFYFEGNHDYNLNEIFPNVQVFDIFAQPVKFLLENGEICELLHGDRFIPKIDFKVLMLLRNKAFLKTLNFIDNLINFKITKAILKHQEKKILYKKHPNFKALIEQKIHNYSAKFIIEGHYHQDEIFNFDKRVYINLNSYAVEQKYYEAKFENGEFKLVAKSLN
ncbi:UDP-2,3-diacylglucosamine diphosphatase [Campylobacter geochelonis]|uniref:Metallophosphoesterase n=1 Tax=Campylobacter geochelonis TaxID=1780362 RepID=A0A128ECH1_9BACT|nr:UDP-2,3-diacylglucosamine diphosphatase [Campylobacter geochelonis]QKF70619.1 UDP-2,3-diacylglucosamine hydrolase [Campylobacter geochelonis]CZE45918.1 metallophosphoesterase [Campylobacter geochelonis]CZE50338.1 metallophosphoesterase [Campylobacter geochelonis]